MMGPPYILAAELREMDAWHADLGLGAEWLASDERASFRVYGATIGRP
jgi:hypothetical protein